MLRRCITPRAWSSTSRSWSEPVVVGNGAFPSLGKGRRRVYTTAAAPAGASVDGSRGVCGLHPRARPHFGTSSARRNVSTFLGRDLPSSRCAFAHGAGHLSSMRSCGALQIGIDPRLPSPPRAAIGVHDSTTQPEGDLEFGWRSAARARAGCPRSPHASAPADAPALAARARKTPRSIPDCRHARDVASPYSLRSLRLAGRKLMGRVRSPR